MSWFDRLTGRGQGFAALERRLLDELTARVAGDNATLLTAQRERINLVQRDAHGRETRLYAMHNGKPERDASLRFPVEPGDHRLAVIAFELPEGRFSAEFYAVDGLLFSIEFTPGAADVLHRGDITVLDVVIELGTAASSRRAEATMSGTSRDSAALQSGAGAPWMVKAEGLHAALRDSDRVRFSEIDAKVPADYTSSLEISNGYRVEGIEVLSLADVYHVALRDATYYVLATVGDRGVLAVRKQASDGIVYLIPFDDEATAAGATFRDALAVARQALGQ
jgi:hypothetical protein